MREDAPAPREDDPQALAQSAPEKTESLIVDGNVRSGQTIMHAQGDVTIIGRVASGAEIVAGGSVHIYGELLCIGGAYVTAENITSGMEGHALEARLDGDELKLRILS